MRLTTTCFLNIAISQLKRNKVRTFLTMLGMIIGVMSVVLLVSIGNGLKFYIEDQFESLGANKLYVIPGNIFSERGFSGGGARMTTTLRFDFKDVSAVEKVDGVVSVSPVVTTNEIASYSGNDSIVEIAGSTTDIVSGQNIKLDKGRFFNRAEESRGAKVVVIGAKVAEDLFEASDPLGKKLSLGGEKLKVIGITEKKGGIGGLGDNPDAVVYVPYKVAFSITGEEDFYTLIAEVVSENEIESAKKGIENTLAKRHDGEDDFSVADQAQILEIIGSILGTITIALAGIASISLLVGGVGIMNIMFVSVTERIKEIGLRKAVGATPRDILIQFLLESVLVSALGGMVGVGLSYLITAAISSFFPATVTLWSIFLAFGVSAFIGIAFGVIPANKAAKLSPIEALRYE
jgi:putative ABC transport system permease protein